MNFLLIESSLALLQSLRLAGEPLTWIAPLVFGAYGLAASYLISRSGEMREALSKTLDVSSIQG